MPFYHRARIGPKKFKLNFWNLKPTSVTLTTGSTKKNPHRINYNTKRGLSASIHGTGLAWRNKNYYKNNKTNKNTKKEPGFFHYVFVLFVMFALFKKHVL